MGAGRPAANAAWAGTRGPAPAGPPPLPPAAGDRRPPTAGRRPPPASRRRNHARPPLRRPPPAVHHDLRHVLHQADRELDVREVQQVVQPREPGAGARGDERRAQPDRERERGEDGHARVAQPLPAAVVREDLPHVDEREHDGVQREEDVVHLHRGERAVLLLVRGADVVVVVVRDVVRRVAREADEVQRDEVEGETRDALALVVQQHLRPEGDAPRGKVHPADDGRQAAVRRGVVVRRERHAERDADGEHDRKDRERRARLRCRRGRRQLRTMGAERAAGVDWAAADWAGAHTRDDVGCGGATQRTRRRRVGARATRRVTSSARPHPH